MPACLPACLPMLYACIWRCVVGMLRGGLVLRFYIICHCIASCTMVWRRDFVKDEQMYADVLYVCVRVCVYVFIHIYVCMDTGTYIHTYIYIYIYYTGCRGYFVCRLDERQ